ncbi:MAG: hypothetical protein QNJ70_11990 [Xenococcaceae cyanobacterium MO_207.B15]|nr:hypothetical protein [Xenococcaceae cyanobacterium MO_207.B15]
MVNKAQKARKVTIDIGVTYKADENDLEAWLDKYLKDNDATRFVKQRLIINSLMTHYLPLVYEYQGASQEKIRQSLIDADREWQIHRRYLQQRLGIDLDSELSTVDPGTIQAPVQQKAKKNSHGD